MRRSLGYGGSLPFQRGVRALVKPHALIGPASVNCHIAVEIRCQERSAGIAQNVRVKLLCLTDPNPTGQPRIAWGDACVIEIGRQP